jgi:hypothetical protein
MIVDATNLEINSIVLEGISGRKMPGIMPALVETMSAWVFQFETLKGQLERDRFEIKQKQQKPSIVEAAEQWNLDKTELFKNYVFAEVDFNTFLQDPRVKGILDVESMNSFREDLVTQMKRKPNAENHNAELFRLLKIQTRLKVLAEKFRSSGLDQSKTNTGKHDLRSIQELRKLWELKDGYIYAQNIVQLDGDIVARTNLRFYRDRRIKNNTEDLLDFHRKNVDVGIKHWHFIVETISSIAGAVGAKIVNPFG